MSLINESNQQTARDSLGGLTKVVPNFIALRLLTAPELTGSVLAICGYVLQDTLGGTFVWNAGSGLPDDNLTVIRPLSVPQSSLGRWVLGSFQNGGGGGGGSDVYLWAADYGVLSNGVTNDTAALQTALNAAGADPLRKTLVLGCGTTLIDAIPYVSGVAGVTIPTGVTLLGEDRAGTIVKIDPASVPSNNHQQRVVIATSDFSSLQNMTLDGNAGAWNKSGWTKGNFLFTRPKDATGLDGIIYRNLTCQNIDAGTGAESAGIDSNSSTRMLIESCDAHDIIGSGISSQGLRYTVKCTDIIIRGCRSWSITSFNGFTIYATDGATVENCQAWDCDGYGFNIEFSDNVRIDDCLSRNNGACGFGHLGNVTGIVIDGCDAINNGGTNVFGANYGFYKQTFQTVNPNTGTNDIGVPQDVVVADCRSTPFSGKPDAFVMADPACNVSMTVPQSIRFDSDNAHNWTILYAPSSAGVVSTFVVGGVQFPRAPRIDVLNVGNWSTWDISGTCALSAYAGTGAAGENPFTQVATGAFPHSGFVIPEFGQILVRGRIKVENAAEFRIAVGTISGVFYSAGIWAFNAQTIDVGQWVTFEMPCRIQRSSGGQIYRLQLQNVAGGPNTVDIDRFQVSYIDYLGVTEFDPMFRENTIVYTNTGSPPVAGYHRHGDMCINSNPAVLDICSWRCTGAGNPGTWTQVDSLFGQVRVDVLTGTAPFLITSTTVVANLNASLLLGANWASPSVIGNVSPQSATFTALTANGGFTTTTLHATAGSTFDAQITSTVGTGTAPLVIASTTLVTNLNADLLKGKDFSAPPAIGNVTPFTAAFTTISATGQITSTLVTGTAPLVVASTTVVANLNASRLLGSTWASPSAIGNTSPSSATFTSLVCNGGFTTTTFHATAGAQFDDDLTLANGVDLVLGTGFGNRIGLDPLQKLGFWNANPVVQPTGYGTPTGAAQTINFPGATATLLQTSQELAQLLLDLKAMGLIGA